MEIFLYYNVACTVNTVIFISDYSGNRLLFIRSSADGSRRFENLYESSRLSTGFSACRRYIFEKSIACPVVTVRARRCLHPRLIFMRRLCRAPLFVCPPHSTAFIYLHIGPAPCKQTKKSTIFSLRADAALEYCSIFRRLSSAARKFLLANRVK